MTVVGATDIGCDDKAAIDGSLGKAQNLFYSLIVRRAESMVRAEIKRWSG